jgi:MFS transporter, SP family, general alpha glucoside:H+ symporter
MNSLKRLSGSHEDIQARLEHIESIVEMERTFAAESSYLDCFRGVNLRRTAIILICMYIPQTVGSALSSNAPYFLNQTGLASGTVIKLTEIGVCMGVVSGIVNIFFMDKFRRRPLMLFGVGLCCVMYLIMGIGGVVPKSNSSLLAIGVALQFTSISYGPAVGSSIAVAGEVSASRLRAKSLGIGNAFGGVVGTFWTFVLPYLFNTDEANLGGNIGWVFLGMGMIVFTIMFFFIPETKGRSFEDLDHLFEKRLPARAFKSYDLTGREAI